MPSDSEIYDETCPCCDLYIRDGHADDCELLDALERCARLERERDDARENYRFMVEKAADEHLDGYRELGQRAADAERQCGEARDRCASLEAALRDLWDEDAFGSHPLLGPSPEPVSHHVPEMAPDLRGPEHAFGYTPTGKPPLSSDFRMRPPEGTETEQKTQHCRYHKEGLGGCMHCHPPPGYVWDEDLERCVPEPGRDVLGNIIPDPRSAPSPLHGETERPDIEAIESRGIGNYSNSYKTVALIGQCFDWIRHLEALSTRTTLDPDDWRTHPELRDLLAKIPDDSDRTRAFRLLNEATSPDPDDCEPCEGCIRLRRELSEARSIPLRYEVKAECVWVNGKRFVPEALESKANPPQGAHMESETSIAPPVSPELPEGWEWRDGVASGQHWNGPTMVWVDGDGDLTIEDPVDQSMAPASVVLACLSRAGLLPGATLTPDPAPPVSLPEGWRWHADRATNGLTYVFVEGRTLYGYSPDVRVVLAVLQRAGLFPGATLPLVEQRELENSRVLLRTIRETVGCPPAKSLSEHIRRLVQAGATLTEDQRRNLRDAMGGVAKRLRDLDYVAPELWPERTAEIAEIVDASLSTLGGDE